MFIVLTLTTGAGSRIIYIRMDSISSIRTTPAGTEIVAGGVTHTVEQPTTSVLMVMLGVPVSSIEVI